MQHPIRIHLLLPLMLCLITFTGCNQFEKHFDSQLSYPHPTPEEYAQYNRISFEGTPRIIKHEQSDFDTLRRLYEDGYETLGFASFNDNLQPDSHLIKYASKIKAEVVTYAVDFQRSETVFHKNTETEPEHTYIRTRYRDRDGTHYADSHITTYTTKTTYEPRTYNIYSHNAVFWTKRISPPTLGTWLTDLTSNELQTHSIQGGVKILAILKSSPAWEAKLIPNDIITKINDIPITRVSQANQLLHQLASQTVTLTIISNNTLKITTANLNINPPKPFH